MVQVCQKKTSSHDSRSILIPITLIELDREGPLPLALEEWLGKLAQQEPGGSNHESADRPQSRIQESLSNDSWVVSQDVLQSDEFLGLLRERNGKIVSRPQIRTLTDAEATLLIGRSSRIRRVASQIELCVTPRCVEVDQLQLEMTVATRAFVEARVAAVNLPAGLNGLSLPRAVGGMRMHPTIKFGEYLIIKGISLSDTPREDNEHGAAPSRRASDSSNIEHHRELMVVLSVALIDPQSK